MHELSHSLGQLQEKYLQREGQESSQDSAMVYKSLMNNIGKYFIFFNTLFF